MLERLLRYGSAPADGEPRGELFLVVPRLGTISPWSSKATDIVHNCGLTQISRIEHGVAWTLLTTSGKAPSRRHHESPCFQWPGGADARASRATVAASDGLNPQLEFLRLGASAAERRARSADRPSATVRS